MALNVSFRGYLLNQNQQTKKKHDGLDVGYFKV